MTSLHATKSILNPDTTDGINNRDLEPGKCDSTNQFKCRIKGRLPHTQGKEDHRQIFCGGTIFVNHSSTTIDMYNQVSLRASNKVRSKEEYELYAGEMGIIIRKYHGDNAI